MYWFHRGLGSRLRESKEVVPFAAWVHVCRAHEEIGGLSTHGPESSLDYDPGPLYPYGLTDAEAAEGFQWLIKNGVMIKIDTDEQ